MLSTTWPVTTKIFYLIASCKDSNNISNGNIPSIIPGGTPEGPIDFNLANSTPVGLNINNTSEGPNY